MTEPRRISNSELSTFKTCKRQWYLAYIRKLVPRREDPTGVAPIGTRIHAVLAEFYRPKSAVEKLAFNPIALHNQLVTEDLIRHPEKADKINKEGDLSRIMLEGYFEWVEETGADEGLIVLGSEKKLEHEIVPGIVLQGKLDARVKREQGDAIMVIDHKSQANFEPPFTEQMKTYLLLNLLENPNERVDGAIYNILRRVKRSVTAKPPFYQRVEVRYNIHVMRDFYQRVIAEIEELTRLESAILSGRTELAFPSPSASCSWRCQFYSICPLMDDKTAHAESVIDMVFEEGNPYQRYQDAEGS